MKDKSTVRAAHAAETTDPLENSKKRQPRFVVKSIEDMAKMDSPFPDETMWALELESVRTKATEHLVKTTPAQY